MEYKLAESLNLMLKNGQAFFVPQVVMKREK